MHFCDDPINADSQDSVLEILVEKVCWSLDDVVKLSCISNMVPPFVVVIGPQDQVDQIDCICSWTKPLCDECAVVFDFEGSSEWKLLFVDGVVS